jgi:fatty-acyl-CoA synthase
MLKTSMALATAFEAVAGDNAKKMAIICGEQRLTFAQVSDKSARLAYGLSRLGVSPGDKLGVMLGNSPEFVFAFFALARLGAVAVLIDPHVRQRQLEHILTQSRPLALLVSESAASAEAISTARVLQRELDELEHLIGVEDAADGPTLPDLMAEAVPEGFQFPEVSPDDLLALIYTSGTTGLPKGAMHSHRSLIAPVVASVRLREMWLKAPSPKTAARMVKVLARYGTRLLQAVGRQQTMLSPMGMHTISGVEIALQCMLMGDRLVLMPRFHPVRMMELVQEERVTVLIAVPMTFAVLLRLKGLDSYNTSSLIICATGSAPCPPELARQIRERFGCAVHIGFGTTELAGGVSATSIEDSDQHQSETVGQAMPGMEIRLVGSDGNDVPSGEVGELICRGENVMLGYYDAPEATAEVVDADGWYHTGDLATMDDGGFLRIVGRKKEMIIRGGQNIYPAEIEGFLVAHQQIEEAAVVGVPTPFGGEEVWSFVILSDGTDLAAGQVLEYCRSGMEAYKIPHRVRFVEDFPRTALGKPQKFKLRELAKQSQAGEKPGLDGA